MVLENGKIVNWAKFYAKFYCPTYLRSIYCTTVAMLSFLSKEFASFAFFRAPLSSGSYSGLRCLLPSSPFSKATSCTLTLWSRPSARRQMTRKRLQCQRISERYRPAASLWLSLRNPAWCCSSSHCCSWPLRWASCCPPLVARRRTSCRSHAAVGSSCWRPASATWANWWLSSTSHGESCDTKSWGWSCPVSLYHCWPFRRHSGPSSFQRYSLQAHFSPRTVSSARISR